MSRTYSVFLKAQSLLTKTCSTPNNLFFFHHKRSFGVLNKKAEQVLKTNNRDVSPSNLAYFYDVPKYTDLLMNLNELFSIYLDRLSLLTNEESLLWYEKQFSATETLDITSVEKEELLNTYENLNKVNKLLKLALNEEQYTILLIKLNKLDKLRIHQDKGLVIADGVKEFINKFKKQNAILEDGEFNLNKELSGAGQRGLLPRLYSEASQTVLSYGRRKTGFAKLFLTPQTIKNSDEVEKETNNQVETLFMVNDRPLSHYFGFSTEAIHNCLYPFELVQNYKFDVKCYVKGSGVMAQSQAIQLALSRALGFREIEYYRILDINNMLAMDLRQVERKKTNKVKARKGYKWRKR